MYKLYDFTERAGNQGKTSDTWKEVEKEIFIPPQQPKSAYYILLILQTDFLGCVYDVCICMWYLCT